MCVRVRRLRGLSFVRPVDVFVFALGSRDVGMGVFVWVGGES